MNELKNLQIILKSIGKISIAFSGGQDSSFLLKESLKVLAKDDIELFYVNFPYMFDYEREKAKRFCEKYNMKFNEIKIEIPNVLKNNPKNRCYYCKKKMFEKIKDVCKFTIVDGTNFSDRNEHRPGMKAKIENEIISPLLEAGITKDLINESVENILSNTCKLTRLPYETNYENSDLEKIEKAENFLRIFEFKNLRIRFRDNSAYIQVDKPEDLIVKIKLSEIKKKFKQFGYNNIYLDLNGYRKTK